jgi:two-component system CheB/CheR fusion protein
VRFNGTAHGVIIVVQPRQRPMQPEQAEEEKLALVTFLEGASLIPENSARTLATGTLDTQTNTALVQQLQSELHLSQSRLSSVREEYEAANEELRADKQGRVTVDQ